jgi:uncharacterized protein YaaW (UPF0174 family)
MESEFKSRRQALQKLLKSKFNEMRVILKVKEKIAEHILQRNLEEIEKRLKRVKELPFELFENSDAWMQVAT